MMFGCQILESILVSISDSERSENFILCVELVSGSVMVWIGGTLHANATKLSLRIPECISVKNVSAINVVNVIPKLVFVTFYVKYFLILYLIILIPQYPF